MDARKNLNCAQVENFDEAVNEYQSSGCSVTRHLQNGCALVDCPGSTLYVCEARDVSVTPHDELDEVADAFWTEEP